jgi:hypothetical protein
MPDIDGAVAAALRGQTKAADSPASLKRRPRDAVQAFVPDTAPDRAIRPIPSAATADRSPENAGQWPHRKRAYVERRPPAPATQHQDGGLRVTEPIETVAHLEPCRQSATQTSPPPSRPKARRT